MAQKTEYQDLEVKGSLLAEKIVNPNEPANYLLRADGSTTSPHNPVNFPKTIGYYPLITEVLTNAATVIEVSNEGLSQIPELLNKSLFMSNNTNVVKQSERLYELIDNETGDIEVKSNLVNPKVGQTLRYTAIKPSDNILNLYRHLGGYKSIYCVYIPQDMTNGNALYKVEYLIYTNATGDGNTYNIANFEWKTFFEKELRKYTEIIYLVSTTIHQAITKNTACNVRVSITPYSEIALRDVDVLYFGPNQLSIADANRLVNFNAVIEPTQTSTEFKSPLWLWQYLVQGVNWLKKNYLPASTLDTKTISDFSDLSASQVNYFVDSTLTDSIFNQKVTFPSDWKGRKICLTLSPVTFQKDWDFSLKVLFADYMKATGARLFVENDLAAMVGVNTLIKIIIDNNIIVIEAYIEA